MIKTRIEITPYLAEYLTCKFYDPESDAVRIPDTKDLYHTIWDLMSKRPDNAVDTGNLTLVLPDRRTGKDPEYYNYLRTVGTYYRQAGQGDVLCRVA